MRSAVCAPIRRSLGAMHLPGGRVDVGLLPDHGDTMTRYLLLSLLAISSTASAVVIRSDVDDVRYHVPASAFPALADMPGEGHGVLLAPQWVLPAAQADTLQGIDADATIGGGARRVEYVNTPQPPHSLPTDLVDEDHAYASTIGTK